MRFRVNVDLFPTLTPEEHRHANPVPYSVSAIGDKDALDAWKAERKRIKEENTIRLDNGHVTYKSYLKIREKVVDMILSHSVPDATEVSVSANLDKMTLQGFTPKFEKVIYPVQQEAVSPPLTLKQRIGKALISFISKAFEK